MPIEFKGEPKNIFGVKWQQITDDQILAIHLSPEATIIAIVEEIGLEDKNSVQNPYMSGCSVDKIPSVDHLPPSRLQAAQEQIQSFLGSLNWLVCCMCIDISKITNMLAHHLHSATPSHMVSACYVVKYLNGYKSLGITFTT